MNGHRPARDAEIAAFRLSRPRPPLDRFVEGIWQVRGRVPVAAEAVLPNGAVELIVNLGQPHRVVEQSGDRWFRSAWVAGLQQGPLTISSQGSTDLIGVRFRPGGARACLHLGLDDLTDDVVELDDCAPARAGYGGLRERLLDAPPARRITLVEEHLQGRLRAGTAAGDARVAAALAALPRARSLSALADEVTVSHKHLISLFRREVGVGPSRLRRILRFDAVVRAVAHVSEPRWAALAAAHGFADQSHLVREFRTFAGVTPRAFLRARLADQAHLDASAALTR